MVQRNSNVLFEALKRKEHDAYKQLFDEHYAGLVHFAEYLLCNEDEAEDIVQGIYADLYAHIAEMPIIKNMKAYMFTEAKNRCMNRLKHLQIEDTYCQLMLETERYITSETEISENDERLQRVYAAIEKLPQQTKAIFRRCVMDGLKYKEVAEEMHISVNTVNTHMSRAYKFLRAELGGTFILFLLLQ